MSGSNQGSAIAFKYFPQSTWRKPGFYPEFNNSLANTAQANQNALIIGQILSSGSATPNVPVQAFSQAQVNALCGADSMMAIMYAAYRLQDPFGSVWIGPVIDNGAGVAQINTITFTGPATAAGVLSLYVMGVPVPVAVSSGDTATVMATNVAAALTAATGVPASATSAAGVVTMTNAHKGAAVADIDLRINYRGIANNEVTPPGVTVAFAVGTAGATNPVFTTLFSNLGTTTFDYIAFPYTDTASLTAIEALLSDQSGRWSAIEALYGHVFSAYRGTVSGRSTFGVSNNNQHLSILGYYDSPTAAWVEAADWCGAHAINYRVNPAVGIVGQALNLLPPPLASQDTPGEQNVLLYDGMSTFNVNEAGQSVIDRSITTYQTNQAGQIDDSYLNTGLLFQAMFVARYLAIQVLSQFLNKILVDDGNIIGPGSPAVTPSLIFQAVCGMYAYLCTQYIVQDSQTFAKNGYAQKGTKGQVLLYLPIDFADAVIQVPALIQFQQTT